MGLETGDYIDDLNAANPLGTDAKSQGDDHLRLVKKVLKQSFPAVDGPVTGTPAQLNNAASANPTYTTLELGHASDTTLARIAAGRVSVEGNELARLVGGVLTIDAAVPMLLFNESDGSVDNRRWRMYANLDTFVLDLQNDAAAANATAMAINRTGNTVDSIEFYGPVTVTTSISGQSLTLSNTAGGSVLNDLYVVRSTTSPSGNVGTNSWLQLYNTTDIDGVGIQLAPGGGFDVWCDPGSGWQRVGRWSTNGLALGASFDAVITRLAADRIAIGGREIGYRNVPMNGQSANYTATMSDSGGAIYHGSGAGAGDTFTIPGVATVNYDYGTTLTFVNEDPNPITIASVDTMTLAGTTSTGSRTLVQNGVATAIKTPLGWLISGSGLS
jgi:hypothetical protein